MTIFRSSRFEFLAFLDDIKWPVIFIEVFSIDSWTRYRTEGYGFIQIPTIPGM